ncbi:hypothetical protein GWI33_011496 [Rhynchophorus ferrugineus]|uniref:Uncharacterized protein n=1 Tax=Rhynchophorus ferrugineus TaxID=354439 RepID=A0A834I6X9_RHYFE|nr:hypothetical protein GWI33_011496 [Rhynchophorus ferrugineus]
MNMPRSLFYPCLRDPFLYSLFFTEVAVPLSRDCLHCSASVSFFTFFSNCFRPSSFHPKKTDRKKIPTAMQETWADADVEYSSSGENYSPGKTEKENLTPGIVYRDGISWTLAVGYPVAFLLAGSASMGRFIRITWLNSSIC